MRMLCPGCGRKSHGLCIDCFLEENPIGLKGIKLSLCTCGNYLHRGRWSKNITKSIEKVAEKNLIIPQEIKLESIRILPEFRRDRISLEIWVSGVYGGLDFSRRVKRDLMIDRRECPACSKLMGGYYEAILQLRTKKPLSDLDINNKFISKIKKVKGGFNIYITSAGYARQVGKLFDELGFLVKESSKLVGMKNGKSVYRVSISIKEPGFMEGDFLRYKGAILQVLRPGKRILYRDVASGKKKTIALSNLRGYEVAGRRSDLREGVVTMVSPEEVQVLDLEENKTYDLENRGLDLEAGQEIDILKLGENIYIL
jgi:nonsense-mediated mRNA decay protein 3